MKWRIERQRQSDGATAYRLRRGRGANRVAVWLGVQRLDDVHEVIAGLELIDAAELGDVWTAWHRRDSRAAIRAARRPDAVEQTRSLGRDWPSTRLRVYWAEVYVPWRSSTTRGWAQEARNWPRILEALGNVRLRDIDAWVMADYLDGLLVRRGRRMGQPMSGTSKRLHRAHVKALLKRAYRLRHVTELPDLGTFRLDGATKPVRPKPEMLSAEEARRLLKAASSPMHKALFATALGQGLRPSELVRVHWEDIDWEVPALVVRGTKTDLSAAVIPITPIALPYLREWWMASGRPAAGHVFVYQGKPYATPTGWRTAFEHSLRRAGIERHLTPYMLRHSFATLAWRTGIPKDIARRILRHTDTRMLDLVYERPRVEDLASRVKGLSL